MREDVVVTGSVAYDYLMKFPGKFLDHFLPDKLHRISVSFLVDEMRRVRGGCAPNIAFAMALLGGRPKLLAAAGRDAADYRDWLSAQGVDCTHMEIFNDVFTASFFVSTDQEQNQIASFYSGAMAKAGELSLSRFDTARVAWVIVSPNDPLAMRRYARECRELSIPFVFDPSQQVARLSGAELREGVDGAAMLICNDYELGVLSQKAEISEEDLRDCAPVVIVTHGADGSTIHVGGRRHAVPPARLHGPALDPTGVGDSYRGGLLRGMTLGLPWDVCGRIASVAAVFCLEAEGPQPPPYAAEAFLDRYRESYGEEPSVALLFDSALS
jgi:adenosine kinase